MKKKIISIVGLLLLAVAPTKMLAQIEVAPIVDFGGVSGPGFSKMGRTFGIGASVRYTFFQDSPSVSLQVRLDAQYSNYYASSIERNLFQNPELAGKSRFRFNWQDHVLNVPLTLGVRFNSFLDGNLSVRAGAYWTRGLKGSIHYIATPDENMTYQAIDAYNTVIIKVPGKSNRLTIAENESRVGIVAAVDYRVWKQLELSASYMRDLNPTWVHGIVNDSQPPIKLNFFKIGAAYWF